MPEDPSSIGLGTQDANIANEDGRWVVCFSVELARRIKFQKTGFFEVYLISDQLVSQFFLNAVPDPSSPVDAHNVHILDDGYYIVSRSRCTSHIALSGGLPGGSGRREVDDEAPEVSDAPNER
ncbi:hypothetical protein TWF970_006686 [Orbilia oligospora]|uniref:Uncharacterized protein n=1 Tax=Orbilia oligospora TaxID=2813651 RepID=A0A7C8VLD0_ORBOL|nr:hypothetical protein TWF970_006686 [Orbilia oligospora]